MRISDRPEYHSKNKPLTAHPSALVVDLAVAMDERNCGSVVIINDDREVVGIFTERDLLKRVVARNLNPVETRVGHVMTDHVKIASASDDVVDWLRQMSNERFRHLPVVDKEGRIEHVMSQGDFVSFTWPELLVRFKDTVTQSYPRIISPIWQIAGVAAYTLAVLIVVRHAL